MNQQLFAQFSGGLELHSWSNLPTGSGLGTSSILAGVILAILWEISGKTATRSDIIHAVLYLEQLLTTGGGWQDQVGGIQGGVKIARSPGCLPLQVTTSLIPLSPAQVTLLSSHLVLIYTGKTRLARNLLQNVVRNWYAREPSIMQNVNNLCATAESCATAFETLNIAAIGECLGILILLF